MTSDVKSAFSGKSLKHDSTKLTWLMPYPSSQKLLCQHFCTPCPSYLIYKSFPRSLIRESGFNIIPDSLLGCLVITSYMIKEHGFGGWFSKEYWKTFIFGFGVWPWQISVGHVCFSYLIPRIILLFSHL